MEPELKRLEHEDQHDFKGVLQVPEILENASTARVPLGKTVGK
jgi:hypothetical protein